MTNFEAVEICEGIVDADRDQQVRAWQHLVDTGLVWGFPGWFGRTAVSLLNAGILRPAGRGVRYGAVVD